MESLTLRTNASATVLRILQDTYSSPTLICSYERTTRKKDLFNASQHNVTGRPPLQSEATEKAAITYCTKNQRHRTENSPPPQCKTTDTPLLTFRFLAENYK